MTQLHANISVDLDNLWAYQQAHGDAEWERLDDHAPLQGSISSELRRISGILFAANSPDLPESGMCGLPNCQRRAELPVSSSRLAYGTRGSGVAVLSGDGPRYPDKVGTVVELRQSAAGELCCRDDDRSVSPGWASCFPSGCDASRGGLACWVKCIGWRHWLRAGIPNWRLACEDESSQSSSVLFCCVFRPFVAEWGDAQTPC